MAVSSVQVENLFQLLNTFHVADIQYKCLKLIRERFTARLSGYIQIDGGLGTLLTYLGQFECIISMGLKPP